MLRVLLRLPACLLLFVISVSGVPQSSAGLAIDEAKSRLEIVNSDLQITLAIENRSGVRQTGELLLEFLSPGDSALAPGVRSTFSVAPGLNTVKFVQRRFLDPNLNQDRDDHKHDRLRYRLTAASGQETRGVVAFSNLFPPDRFRLELSTQRTNSYGAEEFKLRVFALEPETLRGVQDVVITGRLTVNDGKRRTQEISARTGSLGDAILTFIVPQHDAGQTTLEVTGKLGNETHRIVDKEHINPTSRRLPVFLSTDKPMYQPGQTLNIRALAFNEIRKAQEGLTLVVQIEDATGEKVFRREIVTSRFGEAHTEWRLPDDAPLGEYRILISTKDGRRGGNHPVIVRRYELPTFTFEARPDRGYYVAGQKAAVTIDARYLFGQPMPGATVKVDEVFDSTVLATVATGETNAEGQYVASIDPSDALAGIPSYASYQDIGYSVSVTEPATGKTESQRFTLRASKGEIHIGVMTAQPAAEGLPLELLIVTQHADGSPAPSKVSIFESQPEAVNWWRTSQPSRPAPRKGRLLRTVTTNRLGMARLSGLDWKPNRPRFLDEGAVLELARKGGFEFLRGETSRRSPVNAALFLAFEANDNQGRTGNIIQDVRFSASALQVYTDKKLYAAGDPLRVQLLSTYRSGPVIVELRSYGSSIASAVAQLTEGKASVEFPFTAMLQDQFDVTAIYAGNPLDSPDGATTVAYPITPGFRLEAQPESDFFEPGKDGAISFRVRSANGDVREALIGVSIYDAAVLERLRETRYGSRGFPDLLDMVRSELNRADRRQPLPTDLPLAADYFFSLPHYGDYYRPIKEYEPASVQTSADIFSLWPSPLAAALQARFIRDRQYPASEASLHALAAEAGLNNEAFEDPWKTPLRFEFTTDTAWDRMTARSAGPDKNFHTKDDFVLFKLNWPYFQKRGEILDKLVFDLTLRRGAFVRDLPALREALLKAGEDIDTWKSPAGNPFQFVFSNDGTRTRVRVIDSGNDGRFNTGNDWLTDDREVWSLEQDYSSRVRLTFQDAVERYVRSKSVFPETRVQVEEAMRERGASLPDPVNPWGRPHYPVFVKEGLWNTRTLGLEWSYPEALKIDQQSEVFRVARVGFRDSGILLRSAGPDGIEETFDDFDVTLVSKTLVEESAKRSLEPTRPGATGALRGVVRNNEKVVPHANITVSSSGSFISTQADESGAYAFENLPSGLYDAWAAWPALTTPIVRGVPVNEGLTTLNLIRSVYEYESLSMSSSNSGVVSQERRLNEPAPEPARPLQAPPAMRAGGVPFTPRLRDDFPETLVWQPALITDRNGEARLQFKLADNLTTWRVEAVASTLDGRMATASTRFLAYQPFFIEHDPPRVLTEGDEIALPVIVRNYLDEDQSLQVSMKREAWFQLVDAAERTTESKSGETMRETFRFRAIAAIENGRQRVTATGPRASDAIEKPITVKPNGQEITHTETRTLKGQSAFDWTIPDGALPNTTRGELRIYPDLASQLTDAVEGVFQRPYGCAEQVISSSYPSLMILRLDKQGDKRLDRLTRKARQYLESGYARLLGYRTEGGGFSYWEKGEPDVAVTVYATQFLHDATDFIKVDDDVATQAKRWLLTQQQADGSWSPFKSSPVPGSQSRILSLTSLVIRALSGLGDDDLRSALERGAAYLDRDRAADDAYTLASLALARQASGRADLAAPIIERLIGLARSDGNRAYWDAAVPTPFYGWGDAGRLETTALALRALGAARAARSNTVDDTLIDRGLLYLLRHRDHHRVWYSTQATVLVLDTLIGQIVGKAPDAGGRNSRVEILVNGAAVSPVKLVSPDGGPIVVDISRHLRAGVNRVEARENQGGGYAAVQLVENHYVPWPAPISEVANQANDVRLSVRFDRTELTLGAAVTASVEAHRMKAGDYGMMLAEIGLPPGAAVDRASLEESLRAQNSGLYRYEIQPDRVVAYLWPGKDGSRFQFRFRPRYAMDAQTPASVLYDYYNVEARTVVKPTRFIVH